MIGGGGVPVLPPLKETLVLDIFTLPCVHAQGV